MHKLYKSYIELLIEEVAKSKMDSEFKAQTFSTLLANHLEITPDDLIFNGEYLVRYIANKNGRNVPNVDTIFRPTNPNLLVNFQKAKKENDAQIEKMISVHGFESCKQLGITLRDIGIAYSALQARQEYLRKKMMK